MHINSVPVRLGLALKWRRTRNILLFEGKYPFIMYCTMVADYVAKRGNLEHYNDVIMGTMASQMTSLTIVYSTAYSDADQRKHQKFRVTGLCAGNSPVTGEFPAQMASNAENGSIWWRHHGILQIFSHQSGFMTRRDNCGHIVWITNTNTRLHNMFLSAL